MAKLNNRARAACLVPTILGVVAGLSVIALSSASAEDAGRALYVLNADGTGWRRLFQLEGYPACGSPAVSPDGKTIAFDAWQVAGNQQQGPAKIFVADIDGSNPRELCTGQMPSWSADGKFLACSRAAEPYGIWIMRADGAEHKHLRAAWGAQWSPDGKLIAYYEGATMKVYDVEKAETRQIAGGEPHPYRQIFWNMAWSPDSTQICFKGTKPDGTDEIAIVDAGGEQFGFKVRYAAKGIAADFAWHPRGDRIVIARRKPETKLVQLFDLDPDTEDPPTFIKGQDERRNNVGMCWTPDGEQLIVISGG